MGSIRPRNVGYGDLLPSTFSPWRGEGSAGVTNTEKSATTSQDATRASIESTAQSLARSISSSTVGRRGSSAFYSPQSLNAVPHATIPEPPTYIASPQPVASHSTSIRSGITAPTVSNMNPSDTEGQSSLPSATGGLEPNILAVANVDAMRSASIMPQHPGAESIPMSAMYNPTPSPTAIVSEDEGDTNHPLSQCAISQLKCYSRKDVYVKRWSWLYATLVVLSIYSTVFSGIWLVVSIVQPRYGRGISTGNGWQVTPSTATLLATLGAKTIELSFVTVFVAVLGQVLTRRAFSRLSRGVTLAEMTMRNWVIQPGSLLTHWDGIPYAATTFLGALTLTATFCALFYTTASDAMVSPKLSRPGWEIRTLQGLVKSPYSNPYYIRDTCETPLRDLDPKRAPFGCLDVLFSGQSYHSLTAYLAEWDSVRNSQDSNMRQLSDRPTGKHNLFDNTTMDSQWIETESGDVAASFNSYKRIINNVTLAMPHAGIYSAATDPINGILQPSELLGIGEYSIRASVWSPVINVLCANMNENELTPIVYAQWPKARKHDTGVVDDWENDIPQLPNSPWLNRTDVDDIFKWGEKYQRRPPIFPLYPIENNMVTVLPNDTNRTALYILAKSINNYSVCQLSSWMTSKCSSTFNLSGTSGGHMKAHCEDPNDKNARDRTIPDGAALTSSPSPDWVNIAYEWQLAINLNGGTQKNNASNALILTSFALDKPELNPRLPSMAEALAVLVSNTMATGSIDSTFGPVWTHKADEGVNNILFNPVYENFSAGVQTQQYASAHTSAWQVIFYPILLLVFVLNVLCLLYLAFGTAFTSFSTAEPSFKKRHFSSSSPSSPALPFPISFTRSSRQAQSESDRENLVDDTTTDNARAASTSERAKAAKGLVTDYTEPQNLFALAVNSPPSRALAGSCGHGPEGKEMGVPWRVGYSACANHYFFEEGVPERGDPGTAAAAMASGADLLGEQRGPYGKSYKRLSSRRAWL
ncbi:hypothetical protein F5B22DRAFT_641186 [Xylaria bambusicola]|uniref:uncharacterized protein n=1 Tax=Xylaria bambusicola TaxID=326684 RepID=UPI0020076447|nr:uncharacterized protein F5B22DRAFT_641186 [Xylaria bambusicola]KAI0528214.1 hypothetical protein F5B22DRAFT_641186 [Xylaria bambusicola]